MVSIKASQIQSGNFTFTKTSIEGVVIVDTKLFGDVRGNFTETYKYSDFATAGILANFVQDNQSLSTKGVLRGLHYQINYPQAKLMRVVNGAVFDVAVDLRCGSPTFGRWEGVMLSSDNRRQLFVPSGFAHGFLVLSDFAVVCYKCDDVYHPDDEGGVLWSDPSIGIEWPSLNIPVILSEKDKENKLFVDIPHEHFRKGLA